MSEYWKSTPKYWCKFCSTYVRDTNLEKKSHEATPKHQNSIQRSLRELHKKSERDDREKQRAKDEVARLNGLVAAKQDPTISVASGSSLSAPKLKSTAPPAPASVAERKRQMEQLAAMGVAIPEEYRRDMSIQGEWSTVSEKPVYSRPVKSASDEDDGDSKAFGARKRKLDDEEDQDLKLAPKAWGSRLRTYPGAKANDEDDLDALLSGATAKKEVKTEESHLLKEEEDDAGTGESIAAVPDITEAVASNVEPKSEPKVEQDAPVVFKKRKSKR